MFKYLKVNCMANDKLNPEVNLYLNNVAKWQAEMRQLRKIILDCGLSEELKWGKPCYTSEGKNIVIIQGFKNYCALLFFKGFLLSDPEGILVKTGKNTRVGRQIRFTGIQEINRIDDILKTYINEAVNIEKSVKK